MANIPIQRSFVAPGNYTFTVPEGMTQVNIACCGGGGGSAVSGSSNYSYGSFDIDRAIAGSGGGSGVSNIIGVNGGEGGNASQTARGIGPGTSATGGAGGSPNGSSGGVAYDNDGWTTSAGGAGRALGFSGASGNYGRGGNVGKGTSDGFWACGASGGSGGYATGTYAVTPGQVLNIYVGDGGDSAINHITGHWTGWTYSVEKGISGFVIISGVSNVDKTVYGNNITKNSSIAQTNFSNIYAKSSHIAPLQINELRNAIDLLDSYVTHIDNCGNCGRTNCCQVQCGCQSQICQSQGCQTQSCQSQCKTQIDCYSIPNCNCDCNCNDSDSGGGP